MQLSCQSIWVVEMWLRYKTQTRKHIQKICNCPKSKYLFCLNSSLNTKCNTSLLEDHIYVQNHLIKLCILKVNTENGSIN